MTNVDLDASMAAIRTRVRCVNAMRRTKDYRVIRTLKKICKIV